MTYQTFINRLKKGEPDRVHLFVGEEDYLAEIGVNMLLDKLVPKESRASNLTVFDGDKTDRLEDALRTPPLFGGRQVILVRDAELLDEHAINVAGDFRNTPNISDTYLILRAGKIDRRKTTSRELLGVADAVECNKLKPRELAAWIKDYLAKYGKQLDDAAEERLTVINWTSLRDVAGELDRLTLLVDDAPVISARDVDELGGEGYAFERWRLTEAVGKGDLQGALLASNNLQSWNINPFQMLNDLTRMFLNLWVIDWHTRKRNPQAALKETGLHPYPFQKYQEYLRRMGANGVSRGILRLRDADYTIKLGNRAPELELTLLLTDLTTFTRGSR